MTISPIVLVLAGSLASSASASTLVTYWDQQRNFVQYSATLSAAPSFEGTTIKFDERGVGSLFGPLDGERSNATDQNGIQIFTYFDHPSGPNDPMNPVDPFRFYVAMSGFYTGELTREAGLNRISGSYTGQINSIYLNGISIDGKYLSLDVSDPSKPIDYAAVARFIEGTNIPMAIVDGYLHLDRYSIAGSIGGGHSNIRSLSLNIAATSPAPEPVPEPATALTFVALIGGLAYRQLRARTASAMAG
jgi:hypothetical protein